MRRVGLSSLAVAVLGILGSLGLGWAAARLFLPGAPALTHFFIGAALCAAAGGTPLSAGEILLIVAKAVAFLFGAMALGSYLSPKLFRLASLLQAQHMLLVTSLGFCFLLAWLAALIQLAPIVGAFAAGLILDPVHYRDFTDRGEHTIEELIRPLGGFLV